jgi:hypothetical protein
MAQVSARCTGPTMRRTGTVGYGGRSPRAGDLLGRDRVARLMPQEGVRSAKRRGGRGGPPNRPRTRTAGLISSGATSTPSAPISCGSLTSATCTAGKGCRSSRSSSTRTRGWSSAGSPRTTCAPPWLGLRSGCRGSVLQSGPLMHDVRPASHLTTQRLGVLAAPHRRQIVRGQPPAPAPRRQPCQS